MCKHICIFFSLFNKVIVMNLTIPVKRTIPGLGRIEVLERPENFVRMTYVIFLHSITFSMYKRYYGLKNNAAMCLQGFPVQVVLAGVMLPV